MWDVVQLILLLAAYIAISHIIIKCIKKHIVYSNQYLRQLTLSFVYALFWGIGFFGGGADDTGYILPAPNILALGIMMSIGFYRGIMIGLLVVLFWWLLFFIFMLILRFIKNEYIYYKTGGIESNPGTSPKSTDTD